MSELVKCLCSEDVELSEFLRENHAKLFAQCRRWCGGNTADAEDLLSEACLRAFESWPGACRELSSPLGWWITIIANAARDRARKYARGRRASAELANISFNPDRQPSVDEHLSLRRGLAGVNAKMTALARAQRLAVTFRSFGDEYDEIALKLGTSSCNARKLVQLGRRLLRSDCRQLLPDYFNAASA